MEESWREAFARLKSVVYRLREPDGCPWDRAQTAQSLGQFMLEETYELTDAVQSGAADKIREELGDVMLLILLQAKIGEEQNAFDLEGVLNGIADKIIRRHPHVFGNEQHSAADLPEIIGRWNEIKKDERGGGSLLSSVPKALPALLRAQTLQARAAQVGFDWDNADQVLDKVREEFNEVLEARKSGGMAELQGEIGDLLFAAVNLARKLGVSAEEALQGSNAKFSRRFAFIEEVARAREGGLSAMTLTDMDACWDEAKKAERGKAVTE